MATRANSATIVLATSIDWPFRLPICPSGSRPCSSTISVIRLHSSFSSALPTVLMSVIGLHPPVICLTLRNFPGLEITTNLAHWNLAG
ncbi:hypothetical protein HD806DRAFT_527835 [Xylariaceae sp. AK1471]|nr:hypothetical protein HD806DRAFT_527835 [Xylariaceae sp. AK1471]